MDILKACLAIEADVAERGETLDEFLKRAEISRSTWNRWKAGGPGPTLRNWLAVQVAA